MTRDPCRDALEHAITDATQRIERHRGQILRALSWRDEWVVRSVEELRRVIADRAVAREQRELNLIRRRGWR